MGTEPMRTGLTVDDVASVMEQVKAGEDVSSSQLLVALIAARELSTDSFNRARAALDTGQAMSEAAGYLRVQVDAARNRERKEAGVTV